MIIEIITNLIIKKSNLHEKGDYIYIQIIINMCGMETKPQVDINSLHHLDSVGFSE